MEDNNESSETFLRGVYKARYFADKVQRDYEYGIEPGELPGWEALNDLYRIKKRQWTVVTGIPQHGKSTWLDGLMVNLAKGAGWRFLVISPENPAIERHIESLIEIHSGKKFCRPDQLDPRHIAHGITQPELVESYAFIDHHFRFIRPEETDFHMDYLLELAYAVKTDKDDEFDFDGIVLDPYNELEHRRPNAMTETEYIGQILIKWRRFQHANNTHGWIVAHPTKLREIQNATGDPNARKIYAMPSLYDISGSANWKNKSDMAVVVYRNFQKKPETTTISVQKVKFRECGKVGEAELFYDTLSNRFVEHEDEKLWIRARNYASNGIS